MFTSAAGKPNSHRSSNLGTIDRLVQALDKAADLTKDEAQALDTLTSSLQLAYLTSGIFDSLTLARVKMSPKDSDVDYDLEDDFREKEIMWEQEEDPLDTLTSSLQLAYVTSGIFDSLTLARKKMSPKNSDDDYDLEDDFREEKMIWEREEEEDDEVDSAVRKFDSSWGNVTKAAPSLMRHVSTRRSGVRRGRQEAANSTKVIAVPTKFNDGNYKSDSRYHDSINKNRVVRKQSILPAV